MNSNSNKARAEKILRSGLGINDATFHEHQWESISTLVNDRSRLLVVQRTGWGKSAVYFIATKLIREQGFGPTIIISPLLALMRNQIESARNYGVELGSINSSNSREEDDLTKEKLLKNELDAIIISPEKLANTNFMSSVFEPISDRVGLLVIDEAHCISDWGHDFRPDYKRIINILSFLPSNIPVLATTATANKRVMSDITGQLGDDIRVFRGGLTRKSLHLQCMSFSKRSQRLAWLADTLPNLDGTGIIYTATTRDADLVATWLKGQGINVAAYYSGLKGLTTYESNEKRLQLEQDLLYNKIKALVATSALGMGYDKPDLAFVIHFQSPGSVVSYYQQVGRAGRAISKAYGILLSGDEDDDIQRYFIEQAFPKESLVESILEVLEESDSGLSRPAIQNLVNAKSKKIEAALKFLTTESPAPVLKTKTIYNRTLVDYQLPHEAIKRLSEIKEKEWVVMQDYLHYKECLMEYLLVELDDNSVHSCGKCANCDPNNSLSASYRHETGLKAAEFLENIFIEIQPKKRFGNGIRQAESRFPTYMFPFNAEINNLSHKPGRVLCRWGEAGWGEIAMHGKKDGYFDERLMAASAKLIKERWAPNPFPSWLTYIPSHNHPDLVSKFAEGLARELQIQCIDVVHKIKINQPQKLMENTEWRCKNLDGVFEISSSLPSGSVLLIDDAYDSGWTFAIVSALLRQSGSGEVFPFALMSTSTS
jgi:ATP-dependent DNA helicase RecQ